MGATSELSGFVAGLDAPDIPIDVMHHAKRCLIDWLGVTLAGSADPSTEILRTVSEELGSDRTATVLGTGRETTLLLAALTNGFSAHVLDYDDTYNPARTTVHGSAPVWPVVAGFETQIRVALAAGPSHYEAGWHVTDQ